MSCIYCYVTIRYVCIPRNFLLINVCIQGKTLCSPCIFPLNTASLERLLWSRGSVLAFGTQVRGFLGRKNPQHAFLRRGSSFTARKRSIIVRCKSAFRQNYRNFLAQSSTFRRWGLSRGDAWRRLVAKVETSNRDRTISLKGCRA